MKQIEFRAMNCWMSAFVHSDSPLASQAVDQVPGWFDQWEQSLSRFRTDSELSRLNASTGWVGVSDVLWEVICAAQWAERWSGGLVTPMLLQALEAAGYDCSFELMAQRVPCTPIRPSEAAAPAFASAIELDASRRAVRLPDGARLDLGGVAKGWVALQTVRRLQAFGPTLVDAGGDIAMSARSGDQPWSIGVADPLTGALHPDLLIQLSEGGVATSGRDYRRWRAGDEPNTWHHHILDPRTGRPAETDVLTATVVAPSRAGGAVAAEAAAKTAFILGSRAGLEWLEARAPLAGVLMMEDGRVLYSRRMEDYLWGAQEINDGDIWNQNATQQSSHFDSFCQ